MIYVTSLILYSKIMYHNFLYCVVYHFISNCTKFKGAKNVFPVHRYVMYYDG